MNDHEPDHFWSLIALVLVAVVLAVWLGRSLF